MSMYQVSLSDEQRDELNQRAHAPDIAPSTRDRLEMVRLCAAGWRIPAIARHLGQHEQTVRTWIKAYLSHGFAGLTNQARGGSASALSPEVLAAVAQEVQQGQRTWSAAQLRVWIEQHFGIARSQEQVRRKLRQARLSYQRTSRSLRHKQNPEQVQAKRQELEGLEKRGTLETSTCAILTKPALP